MNILDEWNPSFSNFNHTNVPPSMKSRSIKPFSMIICGSRNQGKSTVIRDIYEKYLEGKFDLVIVFSRTLSNGFYQEFLYGDGIILKDDFNPDILTRVEQHQKDRVKNKQKLLNVLILLDDCVDQKIKYNEQINQLFIRGRHLAMSVIFITQSPTLVQSVWRQNTSYLICLKMKGLGLTNLKNNFLLDLVDKDDTDGERPDIFLDRLIKQVFDTRYQCLVVEYEQEGNSLSDCCFTYTADPNFKRRRRARDTLANPIEDSEEENSEENNNSDIE